MNIATNIFMFFVTYFLLTYIKLALSKKEREDKQTTNKKLNNLRKIKYKTLDEQKAFLDAKFPKGEPFKFSWNKLGKILLRAAIFVGTILTLKWIWNTWVGIELNLGFVIIFIIIFPLLSNIVLKRFNLQGDDISVYFK